MTSRPQDTEDAKAFTVWAHVRLWCCVILGFVGLTYAWAALSMLLDLSDSQRWPVGLVAAALAWTAAWRLRPGRPHPESAAYFVTPVLAISFGLAFGLFAILYFMGKSTAILLCGATTIALAAGLLAVAVNAWRVWRTGFDRSWLPQELAQLAAVVLVVVFMMWTGQCAACDSYPFAYTSRLVDIQTGRLKVMRVRMGLPAGYEIQETAVSRAAASGDGFHGEPEWRAVYVRMPYTQVHTSFRSALHQIFMIEMVWGGEEQWPPDVRRKSARDLLRLWQLAGHGYAADDYISLLTDRAFSSHGNEEFFRELLSTPPEDMVDSDGEFIWSPEGPP